MALNFSHRPIFSPHISEDNFVFPMSMSSGYVVDGVPERNFDAYGTSRLVNREVVDSLEFLEDNCEGGRSRDCVRRDVLDLLPSDPFDMDISTTVTAITGWLDDLNVDYGGGGCGRDERGPFDGSYQLFAGLNYLCNNAFRFQAPPGNEGFLHRSGELGRGFGGLSDERKVGGVYCHSDYKSLYLVDAIQTLGTEPEFFGGGFSARSDEREAGGFSFHSDLNSPYLVDTIQSLGIEPEISGGGFNMWSDEREADGVSCHCDPNSPFLVDAIQEISGGGFCTWSDGRKSGGLSCHTDPESSYVVDTIQILGIEPEISRGGFIAWSDGRKTGGLSCQIDPDSSYVVDTIHTLGIEPEISGGGFSAWSDERIVGSLSCHTDPALSYVVETIQTLCIEPEVSGGGFGAWSEGRRAGGVSCHTNPESPPYVVDTFQTLCIEPDTSGVQPVVLREGNCVSSDAGGPPHAAFSFVLAYLGTRELLVVESVCKSLQSTAEGDPFFWRNINICENLDVKITDDVLLKLTSKAQGRLETLSLVNCVMISDDGLNKVLLNNPKVTKLCVPGCTRLTIGGLVDNLKAFKSKGRPGLTHLSIAGTGKHGVTEAQFKELEKQLLGSHNLTQLNAHEPRFYRGGIHYPSCNDGRAIDIERCPKCMNMRIVYDCPVVGCKGIKEGDPNANTQRCRGCILCIARCDCCGRCIDETVHEETFSLDLRCIDCGKKISKCE